MKSLFFKLFLPVAFLCSCSRLPDPAAVFFLAQARTDPELRIEDAYKWLVHATRGGEHAVENEFAVRQWLDQEWATLDPPQPDEPLWVPLMPDGRIGRLNLRPYKARGGSTDLLHAAFIHGAQSFDASPDRFRNAWNSLGRQLSRQPQGFLTRDAWQRLDREMRKHNYPAIHHSADYEKSRHPAYRVLPAADARSCLDLLPSP